MKSEEKQFDPIREATERCRPSTVMRETAFSRNVYASTEYRTNESISRLKMQLQCDLHLKS